MRRSFEIILLSLADVFLGMFMMSAGDTLPSGNLLVEQQQAGAASPGEGGAVASILVRQDSVIIEKASIVLGKDGAAVMAELKKLQAAGVNRVSISGEANVSYSSVKQVLGLCSAAGLELELGG